MRKKWYSITHHVCKETGEMLTKSRVDREHWVKVGKHATIDYSNNNYNLKNIYYHYEKNKQYRIW